MGQHPVTLGEGQLGCEISGYSQRAVDVHLGPYPAYLDDYGQADVRGRENGRAAQVGVRHAVYVGLDQGQIRSGAAVVAAHGEGDAIGQVVAVARAELLRRPWDLGCVYKVDLGPLTFAVVS